MTILKSVAPRLSCFGWSEARRGLPGWCGLAPGEEYLCNTALSCVVSSWGSPPPWSQQCSPRMFSAALLGLGEVPAQWSSCVFLSRSCGCCEWHASVLPTSPLFFPFPSPTRGALGVGPWLQGPTNVDTFHTWSVVFLYTQWHVVKNPAAGAGDFRCRFGPGVGKIPWRWAWQPTPVFLPGESHGQRSLAGYSS